MMNCSRKEASGSCESSSRAKFNEDEKVVIFFFYHKYSRWLSRADAFPLVSKPPVTSILLLQELLWLPAGFDTGFAIAQPYSTSGFPFYFAHGIFCQGSNCQ